MADKALPKTLFPFIRHFLKDYILLTIVFILLVILAGLWAPFNSILIKQVINLLPQVQDGDISTLVWPGSLIIVNFIVFDNFTWRGVEYINYKYQGVIKNEIIKTTFEHVLGSSQQFFQDNLSGRISNQITTLADNIERILHYISLDLIRGASVFLMSFIASFRVHPTFSYILGIWFICFASFSIWASRRLVSLADHHAKKESLLSGQLVDTISNHNNVRIFARKVFELTRIDHCLHDLLKAFKRKEGFIVILYSVQGSMVAAMMGFSIYFLVHFYSLGQVTIGDFALILGLSMQLGHMMWYTMSRVDDFNQSYGKCKQSLAALMIPLEIQDKQEAIPLIGSKGQITWSNVTFHYKGAESLFQNQSIEIKAGQKVGLVGYSGSGKTTFVNLLLRLYDITEGTILIDGQDIRTITQDSLRGHIALIPQDPSLFHRSLMDNIRYGRVEATDQEVIEAAKKAYAHEFIMKLPQGYETPVGERGIKLSGGQRQRIAIARAMLIQEIHILIIDEGTSQMDSITENSIQSSLWEFMQHKTALIIAHRLSTLSNVDRILVFDKGKIVEDGTHHNLLSKEGLYKQLWSAQVGGFLGDENPSMK